jgi:hypothetical protein
VIGSLIQTVIELDQALGSNANILLGGGLGLYLKQQQLETSQVNTLLPISMWPTARTTEDIDLFLRAEVVASADTMEKYKQALQQLAFKVVEKAKWMKFSRIVYGKEVLIDLMVGPLGEYESLVEQKGIRVKPKGTSGLHARFTEDALSIELNPLAINLEENNNKCVIFVPQAFPFALMKLGAFHDRVHDGNKDEGRHHALDLYRIIAMLTKDESMHAKQLADKYSKHPILQHRIETIQTMFSHHDELGCIRLREHPLCPKNIDLKHFCKELLQLMKGTL